MKSVSYLLGTCLSAAMLLHACGTKPGSSASEEPSNTDGTSAEPNTPPAEPGGSSAPVTTGTPGTAPTGSGAAVVPPASNEGGPVPVPVTPPQMPNDEGPPPTMTEPDPGDDDGDVAEPPTNDPGVGPEPTGAIRALCSGEAPISCHFGGAPGNYDVSVVLGGPAAANTTILAEARRVMLGPIATAAGETKRFSFVVNVRQPEGEPIQAVPAGTPGLDLYFQGSAGVAAAVQAIGYAPAASPLAIYVAGDSTVADQTDVEYGGWAQQLPRYFDYPVVVANYSDSGESSGSFLNARPLFGVIESQLKAGDYVLIQFGHNDKTVTAQQFHDNLTSLVTRTKAKAALPVLFTPVARAQFTGTQVSPQHINGTGADLPAIVAQVAAEQGVPMLDLTARTSAWLSEVGPNGWQAFHALGTDATHTNDAGAAVEAGFVRDLIVQANLGELVSRLR